MTEKITLYDAAHWVVSMAATDGVVTPGERNMLKKFAQTYDINVSALYKMAYAIANMVVFPEVEFIGYAGMKGRKFEDFVVSLYADKSRFKLLAWRGDKISGETYALENLLPDLHLRHKLDNLEVEYFVECKYRSSWGNDGIDLSGQFLRYHFAAKDRGIELFIALGIGGFPSNPDEFYLIPDRMIGHDKMISHDNFIKCLCPKDSEGLHRYILHYFRRRVFKKM